LFQQERQPFWHYLTHRQSSRIAIVETALKAASTRSRRVCTREILHSLVLAEHDAAEIDQAGPQ
jgi:hypothetical protein